MPIFDRLNVGTKQVKLWIPIYEVESEAIDQIKAVAALPETIDMAIMPDCHSGAGATIGSVIVMNKAIGSSLVGSDIGCGLLAAQTNLTLDSFLSKTTTFEARKAIEQKIPTGFNWHDSPLENVDLDNLWQSWYLLTPSVRDFKGLQDRALCQLGTLGGGNHFIEISVDEKENIWLVLHSGSRNVGNKIGQEHLKIATSLEHNKRRQKALSTFLAGTKEYDSYLFDLCWAQSYALLNRDLLFLQCMKALSELIDIKVTNVVKCHHNFAELVNSDTILIRKGAIEAYAGQKGIIPGSMGSKTYVVEGLGNPDSWNSASHGAGRKMSRSKAKERFTLEDLEEMTRGIECRKDRGVLDEIPGAYKSIEQVMEYQNDLVVPVVELEQIICIKG